MSARYFVSGRVQGVFFRASAREQALREGIDGWARNLADGRVEVLVRGSDTQALQRFERWLHQGPPQARVDEVQREHSDENVTAGFAIR